MGREIRRVPVGWEHPTTIRTFFRRSGWFEEESFVPMFDDDYTTVVSEWDQGKSQWEAGTHPDQEKSSAQGQSWEEWWGRRPDPDEYMPAFDEPCDGWCVYENVSEGTPVTPVFASAEELIDYLVANGDFWDQKRRAEGTSRMNCDPWPREQAESFVKRSGWMPSLMIINGEVKRFPED